MTASSSASSCMRSSRRSSWRSCSSSRARYDEVAIAARSAAEGSTCRVKSSTHARGSSSRVVVTVGARVEDFLTPRPRTRRRRARHTARRHREVLPRGPSRWCLLSVRPRRPWRPGSRTSRRRGSRARRDQLGRAPVSGQALCARAEASPYQTMDPDPSDPAPAPAPAPASRPAATRRATTPAGASAASSRASSARGVRGTSTRSTVSSNAKASLVRRHANRDHDRDPTHPRPRKTRAPRTSSGTAWRSRWTRAPTRSTRRLTPRRTTASNPPRARRIGRTSNSAYGGGARAAVSGTTRKKLQSRAAVKVTAARVRLRELTAAFDGARNYANALSAALSDVEIRHRRRPPASIHRGIRRGDHRASPPNVRRAPTRGDDGQTTRRGAGRRQRAHRRRVVAARDQDARAAEVARAGTRREIGRRVGTRRTRGGIRGETQRGCGETHRG